MLLLAVDTSGKQGSVALARGEADGSCTVLEVVPIQGGTFSAQLIPLAADLLARYGISKHQLEALAAASGPGSFTGLRVGLAAIKGLAEALGKPIAAVSLLEALVVESGLGGEVLAALDAGRNEVYVGEYKVTEQPQILSERLLTMDEFRNASRSRMVVTPDSHLAEQIRDTASRCVQTPRPQSDAIARLGYKKILAGLNVKPEELEANYIRRSDAEIFSKPA